MTAWRKLAIRVDGDGPLLVVVLAVVILGVVLRVHDLGFPPGLTFDEHHFVENARNYLAGRPDWNDHPPLGKLLIAVAVKVAGDNGVGWRLVPMLFGLASIALAYGLGRQLFRNRAAAWIAAAFVAGDGFLLSYSRTALLDGMLTSSILLTALLVVRARTPLAIMAAAAIAGCALSIKLSGATLYLPLVIACLAVPRGRQRWAAVLALAVLPLVYVAEFAVGLRIAGQSFDPVSVLRATRGLVSHHLALHDMTNPATSHWYTWFLPTRPITLRFDPAVADLDQVRGMTTLGNLALWWASALAVLVSAMLLLLRVLGRPRPEFVDRNAGALGWLLLFWIGLLLPWILTHRDSYIYHYLPSYTIGLVLLAGWLAELYRRRRLAALAALVIVVEITVFYAPVWAQLPLTEAAWNARLFIPMWR